MMRFAFALAIPMIAGGCAIMQPSMVSYVGVSDLADVSYVVPAISTYVATKLPASSVVQLEKPAGGWDPVTADLITDLRSRGFTVPDDATHAGRAHMVSYVATPFDGGMLVEISIDGTSQASRFLARDKAGKLEAGGPYTVREASL